MEKKKKKDSILFSYEAFCTCPFLSQWYLALGQTSKPFSGLGVLEGLTCCCCSSLLIPLPCFLPPELCVWPSWRRAHACASLRWHRPGHLDFLQHYQPRCADLGAGGQGEAGPGSRTPLGVVVSIIPAVLLACRPATVSHLPNEAGL